MSNWSGGKYGYKSWQDSANAEEWGKAAEEFLNDPIVTKAMQDFGSILTILREVNAQLQEVDYMIINSGLDSNGSFMATYKTLNGLIADFISPALGMKERGELEGVDRSFLDAIDQLYKLRVRIDDLDRFQFDLEKLQAATWSIERILGQYADVRVE